MGRLMLGAGLAVLLVVGTGFLIERWKTLAAFDRLEAEQTTEVAQRLGIAVDAEIRLLRGYGATNSIWDDTRDVVANADTEAMAEAFTPEEVHRLYGVDGILAVGPDGDLRAGGLTSNGTEFTKPPAELTDVALLAKLYRRTSPAGQADCGVVRTSVSPYLFCGLAAYGSDGSGESAGGLVFLKAIDNDTLTTIGQQLGAAVALVDQVRPASKHQADRNCQIGAMRVTTAQLAADRLAVDMALPVTQGGSVLIETTAPRPIHDMATANSKYSLIIMLGIGVALLVMVIWLMCRAIARQILPLRGIAQEVISSGDWSLRIGRTGDSEIAKLGGLIDQMLDALERKSAEAVRYHDERQRQMQAAITQRSEAEQAARAETEAVLAKTSALVVGPLAGVTTEVVAVRSAADRIDQQVECAEQVTAEVIGQATTADKVLAGLGASLVRVGGIANLINSLAAQTNLLALNATIEASRAGAAGAGFHVVAREVKTLASGAISATEEISAAIATLQHSAGEVATSLETVTRSVTDIGEATTAIRQAADLQRTTMSSLDDQVNQALMHAKQMTIVTTPAARIPEHNAPGLT